MRKLIKRIKTVVSAYREVENRDDSKRLRETSDFWAGYYEGQKALGDRIETILNEYN